MKTPDEIKKGLECALCDESADICGVDCPCWSAYSIAEMRSDTHIADALAYINTLEADVDNLMTMLRDAERANAKQMAKNLDEIINTRRWISVEERLPEDVVDVLLFVRFKFDPECRIQLGWHIEDEWHDSDGNIYGEVTHWMPLPEPPKEEE